MPKSKRSKVVSLTKTAKKDRSRKEDLLKQIQENSEKLCGTCGKSSNPRDARIFFGKCAVMSKALGASPETEHRLGLNQIAQRLKGQTGLFFTSYDPEKVVEWFDDFKAADFARAGNLADRDVVLPVGPINRSTDPPEAFPHNMDPQLRSLGLKTSLAKGVPSLTSEHVVCRKGQTLTAEQAQLLKLLLIRMITFRVSLYARWEAKTGQVTELKPDDDNHLQDAGNEGDEVMSE